MQKEFCKETYPEFQYYNKYEPIDRLYEQHGMSIYNSTPSFLAQQYKEYTNKQILSIFDDASKNTYKIGFQNYNKKEIIPQQIQRYAKPFSSLTSPTFNQHFGYNQPQFDISKKESAEQFQKYLSKEKANNFDRKINQNYLPPLPENIIRAKEAHFEGIYKKKQLEIEKQDLENYQQQLQKEEELKNLKNRPKDRDFQFGSLKFDQNIRSSQNVQAKQSLREQQQNQKFKEHKKIKESVFNKHIAELLKQKN